MGERRVVNWVTAVLLGGAGGSVAAFLVMLALRMVTGSAPGDGEPGPMVLLVGYVVWAVVALAISAWWLRRRWRER